VLLEPKTTVNTGNVRNERTTGTLIVDEEDSGT
jgi:hypothetical protein